MTITEGKARQFYLQEAAGSLRNHEEFLQKTAIYQKKSWYYLSVGFPLTVLLLIVEFSG